MPSEDSSSELFAPGAEEYYRKVLKLPPKAEPLPAGDAAQPLHKWKNCNQCRHAEHSSACTVCRCLAVTSEEELAATCRSAGGCPEHPTSEEPRCEGCGHAEHSGFCRELVMPGPPGDVDECGCLAPAEPPLTPEEEEEAPEDEECTCGRTACESELCDCDSAPCPVDHAAEAPPQPQRRPPYAVAYAVQGHLYEINLPGDATVVAVDGTLTIEHALGPVAGIVQVLPIDTKEAS